MQTRYIPKLLALSIATALPFISVPVFASYWSDLDSTAHSKRLSAETTVQSSRQVRLIEDDFRNILNSASMALPEGVAAKQLAVEIDLPLPEGGTTRLRVEKSPVVAASLYERYPELMTWKVYGMDGKVQSGRLDFTERGVHGMLSMANGRTVMINPEEQNGERIYTTFYSKEHDHEHDSSFMCETHEKDLRSFLQGQLKTVNQAKPGEDMNNYRIAIATTAQFTNKFGSKAATLSAITSILNRVNEIYERDLSIHLNLVDNEDILFEDVDSDPYVDSDPDLLQENQDALDNTVGSSNYDVGHLFTLTGGGYASLGVVCDSDHKGRGQTGFVGDSNGNFVESRFAVDYFAHELGHQFGASHTFNSPTGNCAQRTAQTSYEPGSGSTIMSYAGLCGSDNLQLATDAMFHSGSILQIKQHAHTGTGSSCANLTTLNNSNPVSNPGSSYTIPANTPIELIGSATDADSGDTITYSWEQFNASTTGSAVDVDTGDNAIVRTRMPTATPNRMIPPLTDILNGTTTLGEKLPEMARSASSPLTFVLVARDGKGGTSIEEVDMVVTNDGPFKLSSHNTVTSENAGFAMQVAWDVAGTDAAPISCSTVDISLSTDGGNTFGVVSAGTANDGSELVTVPANTVATTTARLKVKCSDNIFFDISDVDFAITRTPVIGIEDAEVTEGNSGTTDLDFTVSLNIAQDSPVSFSYASANGSAAAGNDYTAVDTTATIAAGQLSTTVTIPVLTDTVEEGDESFTVTLSNPSAGSSIDSTKASATGTILNDDTTLPDPVVSIASIEQSEGNNGTTEMTFTVSLSRMHENPVTIQYATADGSAVAGDDYVSSQGSVTIAAGQLMATFTVSVVADNAVEQDESFTVTLSNPPAGVLLDSAKTTATATILNDDVTLPTPTVSGLLLDEQGSEDQLELTISIPSAESFDAVYDFEITTPLSRLAYAKSANSVASGQVTIPAGQTSAMIQITPDLAVSVGDALRVSLTRPGTTQTLLNADEQVEEKTVDVPVNNISSSGGGGGSLPAPFIIMLSMLAWVKRKHFKLS